MGEFKLNPILNPERANLPIFECVPLDADARRKVAAELEGTLPNSQISLNEKG